MDRLTVGALLDRCALVFPEKEAVVFGDRRITWAQLNEEANKLAVGMMGLGVKRDDKVGLWMPNSAEWIVSWFAISKIGAIIIPMDTWYKPSEAQYILEHSDSVAVVVADEYQGADFIDMMAKLRQGLPNLKHVIVTGEPGDRDLRFNDVQQSGIEWRTARDFFQIMRKIDPDDVAFILYTSGTTGKPKGAMLTHDNIVRNATDVGRVLETSQRDRVLIPVPFSHCFGNVLSLTLCAAYGATMVPVRAFNADEVLNLVEKERCTILHGVPTMFIRELEVLERQKYDTSGLRTGIMAGAPCPVETMKGVMEQMHCNICIGYGLTEASPLITMTRFDDPVEKRVETVGKELPDVEVRIVDDENRAVPQGTVGELCCRGYNVMKGYYKSPEATALAIDSEGWLHSGDLAVLDAQGYYSIVGRKKDMVIVGGFNVYPTEIEEELMKHPLVQEVAVFGVPDKDLGEVVGAAVIPVPGAALSPEDVVNHLYGNVASAKVPRYVTIGMPLPISGRGKVQKFRLREEFKALAERGELKRVVPTALRNKQQMEKLGSRIDKYVAAGRIPKERRDKLEKLLLSINEEQERVLWELLGH
jgi:fatty-acyl-CoA synthase